MILCNDVSNIRVYETDRTELTVHQTDRTERDSTIGEERKKSFWSKKKYWILKVKRAVEELRKRPKTFMNRTFVCFRSAQASTFPKIF